MKLSQMIVLLGLTLLSACGPSEQQKAKLVEQKRIECLDKFCPGDVEPKRDALTEVAIKLNGQWFIGPSKYGNPNFGAMVFFWPSRAPGGDAAAVAKAHEVVKNKVGAVDNFYEVGIELFLRRHDGILQGRSQYERLRLAEAEGRLISKGQLRPGLEVWRVKEQGGLPGVWYVATDLKGYDGNSPVLWCSEQDVNTDFCTMGFIWRPGIAGDMRFHAKHGPDWPEIHLEAIRVLQLLRKT